MADLTFTIDIDSKDAIDSANNLQKEIKTIFDKTAGKNLGKEFDQTKVKMNKAAIAARDLQRRMEELSTKEIGNTHQYQRVLDKIAQYNKQYELAKKNLANMPAGSAVYNDAYEVMKKNKAWLDIYQRLKTRMEQQGKDKIYGKDTDEYSRLAEKLGDCNNRMALLVSSAKELAKEGMKANDFSHRLGKGLDNVKKSVTKVIGAFKKIATQIAKAVSGLGKLTSRMLGINKASEKHNMSLKKMINQVLRYGLGIRSLFILWRKLRAYTADALKLMATQFKEVDADVSALMNSFNQMKLSFGTMAQPLMHALAPALIYIIELITRAMTALANFFAILTGQKFIYKAQKANDSYADSIKGVGGAAKEANKELAEYDNLLVIKSQDEGGGGGGGAGGMGDLASQFEKVAAESDFAKQIKDAINKGDWEGVGGLFADKLNIITEAFDKWINNKFRPAGVKWANRIARILNGLVGEWNSSLAGKTLADGLNAILDIYNTWLTTFDFKKLGTKLKDGIKGFLDNMDPKLLGTTLANKINAMVDFATGLLTDFPWAQTGEKLGTALRTFFETVKWQDIGADLTSLASGILTALSTFIKESKLGSTVGTAINEFLNGIDFGQLAEDLSECAINILDAIADLIITIDWHKVGEAIAEFLTHIDWLGLIEKLTEVALALLGGLAEALTGLASNPEALADIATALLAIFAVKKIWKGITGLFKTNVASSITSGVTSASKSSGLISKVSNVLTKFFETSVGKVVGAIGAGYALFEFGSSLAGSIGSVIATAVGDDEMAAEYQKMSQAPTKYLYEAAGEIGKAATEYSQTTGGTTLGNAISDMLTGGPDTLDKANKKAKEISDSVNETFQRAQYSYDVLGLHELVSDEEWEKFKNSCDDYVAKINELTNATGDGKDALNGLGDSAGEASGKIITAGEDIGTTTEKYQYMADELERLSKLYPQINSGQLSSILSTSWDLFPEDTDDRLAYVIEQIENLVGTVQDGEEKITSSVENVGNVIELTGDKYKYMSEMIEELSQTYSNINPGQLASIISTAFDLFPGDTTTDLYNRSKYVQQMIEMLTRTVDTSSDEMTESVNGASRSITTDFNNTKQSIINSAKESITGIKDEWNNADVKGYFTERSNDITTSFDNVPLDLSTTFDNALNGVKTSFTQDALTDHFSAVKENIETPFKSLPQFFNDTFTESWNKAESAFSSGNTTFNNFNAKLSEGMTNTINNLIGGLNSAVSGPLQKIQEVINKFKNVKIGASSLFSNLPSFSNIPHIPKLAQGAVIPPNREFLAMLGDQTNGTNIETPLATMVQAFKTALSEMGGSSTNQNIVLQLDGRTVAQCVWDEEDKRYKQTGRR